MFDKLEDLVKRLDEVMQELSEPDVVSDQNRFRNLMKEQNELAPIVEKYKEYKEAKQTIEDSVEMLEEEHDEEMRELLQASLHCLQLSVWLLYTLCISLRSELAHSVLSSDCGNGSDHLLHPAHSVPA